MRRVLKANYLWVLCLVVAVVAACSDDDSEPVIDAGPDGSAGTTKAGRGAGSGGSWTVTAGDGAGTGSAGRDGGGGRDSGDPCSAYPEEPMPLFPHGDEPVIDARRAPLAELCPTGCGGSLADFMADLDCTSVPDDGGIDDVDDEFDGGIHGGLFRYWLRSEGCGSVQFATIHPSWPRHYNFDADTGKLIGFAQLDDVGGSLPGMGEDGCRSATWIAGEIRQHCGDEQLSVCQRRP